MPFVPVWQGDRIGFIKIDVEGRQLAVLRGAPETLRRFKPALLVEIGCDHNCWPTFELLGQYDYGAHALVDGADLSPITFDDLYRLQSPERRWLADRRYGRFVYNVVFLANGTSAGDAAPTP